MNYCMSSYWELERIGMKLQACSWVFETRNCNAKPLLTIFTQLEHHLIVDHHHGGSQHVYAIPKTSIGPLTQNMAINYRGSSCAHQMLNTALSMRDTEKLDNLVIIETGTVEQIPTFFRKNIFLENCRVRQLFTRHGILRLWDNPHTSRIYSRRSQHNLEAGELGKYLLANLAAPAGPATGKSSCRVTGIGDASRAGWKRNPQSWLVSKPEAMEEDIERHIFSAVPEEKCEICQPWFVRTVHMNAGRIGGSSRSTSSVLGGWEVGKGSLRSQIGRTASIMSTI